MVIPLLKKLNLLLEELKNYRPVSNLSFLSKVIERVVAKRTLTHMDLHNLHELLQSSYKCFHSCETALIKVKDDILRAIDEQRCVLLVLLDLSAAFDTVDHKKLLNVLADKIGLGGSALEWFASYLSARTQSVIIDGCESDAWNLLFGVPQGSVLGPILFVIYTSPLGDIMRNHGISFHLYADDTQLYMSFEVNEHEDVFKRMEKCITEIRIWMANSFLKLNDSKTEVIIFGTKHKLMQLPNLALHIGDNIIKPSESARNIGAYFDSTLSMKKHVSFISKGAWYHLRLISQIRPYLTIEAAKILMHSFVSSRLDNFNSLLYGISKQELSKLQRIQNAAARVVTGTRRDSHITPILCKLHWLPVQQRIYYKILLLTYKGLNGKAPKYICDLLVRKESVTGHTMMHRSDNANVLIIPRSKKKFGENSFSHAAPYLWNKLPVECRAAKSVDCFKSHLKTYLFKQAFNV